MKGEQDIIPYFEKANRLQREVAELESEERRFKVQMQVVDQDCSLLERENVRLKKHLRKFQADVSSIIG